MGTPLRGLSTTAVSCAALSDLGRPALRDMGERERERVGDAEDEGDAMEVKRGEEEKREASELSN